MLLCIYLGNFKMTFRYVVSFNCVSPSCTMSPRSPEPA